MGLHLFDGLCGMLLIGNHIIFIVKVSYTLIYAKSAYYMPKASLITSANPIKIPIHFQLQYKLDRIMHNGFCKIANNLVIV